MENHPSSLVFNDSTYLCYNSWDMTLILIIYIGLKWMIGGCTVSEVSLWPFLILQLLFQTRDSCGLYTNSTYFLEDWENAVLGFWVQWAHSVLEFSQDCIHYLFLIDSHSAKKDCDKTTSLWVSKSFQKLCLKVIEKFGYFPLTKLQLFE